MMSNPNTNDWIRVQSRSTGAYYWSNTITGESAWELDSKNIEKVEFKQYEIQNIPSGGAYIVAQWVVREDVNGQLYYQNIFSGEIRDQAPEEAIIVDPHSLDPTHKQLNEDSMNSNSHLNNDHINKISPSSPSSSYPSAQGGSPSQFELLQHNNININNDMLFSSKELDQARSELIRYLETLTKVDESLGEILSTMPAALKRNIESDQFRMRANARFKELHFFPSTNFLTADEFAPQAADLVSDKRWKIYLDPAEISRAYLKVFGSQIPKFGFDTMNDNQPNDTNLEDRPSSLMNEQQQQQSDIKDENILRKVAFQRILACSTIVTFLESHGGVNLSSDRHKLMSSLEAHLEERRRNSEGKSAQIKAERIASERTKQLTSTPTANVSKKNEMNDQLLNSHDSNHLNELYVGFCHDTEEILVEAFDPLTQSQPSSTSTHQTLLHNNTNNNNNNINSSLTNESLPPPPVPLNTRLSERSINSMSSVNLRGSITDVPHSKIRAEVFIRRNNGNGSLRIRYGMVPITAKPYKDFIPSFGVLEFQPGVLELSIPIELIRPTIESISASFQKQSYQDKPQAAKASPISAAGSYYNNDNLPIRVVKQMELQLRSPSFDDSFNDHLLMPNTPNTPNSQNDDIFSSSPHLSTSLSSPRSLSLERVSSFTETRSISIDCASCIVSLQYTLPNINKELGVALSDVGSTSRSRSRTCSISPSPMMPTLLDRNETPQSTHQHNYHQDEVEYNQENLVPFPSLIEQQKQPNNNNPHRPNLMVNTTPIPHQLEDRQGRSSRSKSLQRTSSHQSSTATSSLTNQKFWNDLNSPHRLPYQNQSILNNVCDDSYEYSLKDQMSKLHELLKKPVKKSAFVFYEDDEVDDVHDVHDDHDEVDRVFISSSSTATKTSKTKLNHKSKLSSLEVKTDFKKDKKTLSVKDKKTSVVDKTSTKDENGKSYLRRGKSYKVKPPSSPEKTQIKSPIKSQIYRKNPTSLGNKSQPDQKGGRGGINNQSSMKKTEDSEPLMSDNDYNAESEYEQNKSEEDQPAQMTFSSEDFGNNAIPSSSNRMSMDRPPHASKTYSSTLMNNSDTNSDSERRAGSGIEDNKRRSVTFKKVDYGISSGISRLWNTFNPPPPSSSSNNTSHEELKEERNSEEEESDISDYDDNVSKNSSKNEREGLDDEIQYLQEESDKVNERLASIAAELRNAGVDIDNLPDLPLDTLLEHDNESNDGDEGLQSRASFTSLRNSIDLQSTLKKNNRNSMNNSMKSNDKFQELQSRKSNISQEERSNSRHSRHSSSSLSRSRGSPNRSRNRSPNNRSRSPPQRTRSRSPNNRSRSRSPPQRNRVSPNNSPQRAPGFISKLLSRNSQQENQPQGQDNQNQPQGSSLATKTLSQEDRLKQDDLEFDKEMLRFLKLVFTPIIACSIQLSTIKCTPHVFFKLCGLNSKQAQSRGQYLPVLTIQDLKKLCKKVKVDYLSPQLGILRKAFKLVDQGEFNALSSTVEAMTREAEATKLSNRRTSSLMRSSPSQLTRSTSTSISKAKNAKKSVLSGNVISFSLWSAAWSAYFEGTKLVPSPVYVPNIIDRGRGGEEEEEGRGRGIEEGRVEGRGENQEEVRNRARKNWLKVLRTVSTARYWSTLTNFAWKENNNYEESNNYEEVNNNNEDEGIEEDEIELTNISLQSSTPKTPAGIPPPPKLSFPTSSSELPPPTPQPKTPPMFSAVLPKKSLSQEYKATTTTTSTASTKQEANKTNIGRRSSVMPTNKIKENKGIEKKTSFSLPKESKHNQRRSSPPKRDPLKASISQYEDQLERFRMNREQQQLEQLEKQSENTHPNGSVRRGSLSRRLSQKEKSSSFREDQDGQKDTIRGERKNKNGNGNCSNNEKEYEDTSFDTFNSATGGSSGSGDGGSGYVSSSMDNGTPKKSIEKTLKEWRDTSHDRHDFFKEATKVLGKPMVKTLPNSRRHSMMPSTSTSTSHNSYNRQSTMPSTSTSNLNSYNRQSSMPTRRQSEFVKSSTSTSNRSPLRSRSRSRSGSLNRSNSSTGRALPKKVTKVNKRQGSFDETF